MRNYALLVLLFCGIPSPVDAQAQCQLCVQTCEKATSALAKKMKSRAFQLMAKRQAVQQAKKKGLKAIFGSFFSFKSPSTFVCGFLGLATGGVALPLCGMAVNHVASSMKEGLDLQKEKGRLCREACARANLCAEHDSLSVRSSRKKKVRVRKTSPQRQLTERDLILKTVEALYNAWQEINFRAYFALWDSSAVRVNHQSGTRWDYDTIISRRIKAFSLYREVTTRYTCGVGTVEGETARVTCLYDWIGVYKKSGKKEVECLSKEYYILRKIEGTWLIVENHDYSNYQGGMFQWKMSGLSSKRKKQFEKSLRKDAAAYMEKESPSIRATVDKGTIVAVDGVYWAEVTMESVQKKVEGSRLHPNDPATAYLKSSNGLQWEGVVSGTAGLEESLPASVRAKFESK